MDTFFQINGKKNDSTFISMKMFNDSIKRKKSTDQRSFSPFKENLDLFYLCLLVGLKYNVKSKIEQYELGELTDEWTKELSENSNARDYIIALYLIEVTKNQSDKANIKLILNKSLNHKKRTSLSNDGLKEIHEYCFGGYEKMLSFFNYEIPSSIVDFLIKYKKLIDNPN
jgi:hypothetical protein